MTVIERPNRDCQNASTIYLLDICKTPIGVLAGLRPAPPPLQLRPIGVTRAGLRIIPRIYPTKNLGSGASDEHLPNKRAIHYWIWGLP